MKLRLADPSDSEALIQFFANHPTRGNLPYMLKRKDDFFALYKMQSREFKTYILFDPEDNQIHGCATFVMQTAILQEQPRKIAFATDLRISPNRKAILSWGKYFLPLLKELKQDHQIDFFFSVLNLSDTQLLNTFIRNRSPRRDLPRYHLFRKVSLVSLHGQYPWAPKPLSSLEIKPGRTQDFAELTNYLQKQSKSQTLHTDWHISTFFEKLRPWKDISIENFHIARNKVSQEIVGCVLPWSPHQVQEYIPLEYSRVADNFRQFLKFAQALGFGRRLVKSLKKSGNEMALPVSFLTHFYADNEDVMEALAFSAWKSQGPLDFLTYSAFPSDLHMKPPPSWITAEHPYAIYCMLAPDEVLPEFLSPYHVNSVELDPQWF